MDYRINKNKLWVKLYPEDKYYLDNLSFSSTYRSSQLFINMLPETHPEDDIISWQWQFERFDKDSNSDIYMRGKQIIKSFKDAEEFLNNEVAPYSSYGITFPEYRIFKRDDKFFYVHLHGENILIENPVMWVYTHRKGINKFWAEAYHGD